MYRDRLKRFTSLCDRRYIITIADDDRRPLDKLCQKLTAADIACDVMRNVFGSRAGTERAMRKLRALAAGHPRNESPEAGGQVTTPILQ